MDVILKRFKECSAYKNEIVFHFCEGYNTTLDDIHKAIVNNTPETNIPFGDTDKYIPPRPRDINYHLQRVVYFIKHPEEIRDIYIKSSWWIKDNTLFAYPHVEIEDGYHRIAAAFYLNLDKVSMKNFDYIRADTENYITGKSNDKPLDKIISQPLRREVP